MIKPDELIQLCSSRGVTRMPQRTAAAQLLLRASTRSPLCGLRLNPADRRDVNFVLIAGDNYLTLRLRIHKIPANSLHDNLSPKRASLT